MKIWRGSIGYFSFAHSMTRFVMGPSSSIVQPGPLDFPAMTTNSFSHLLRLIA